MDRRQFIAAMTGAAALLAAVRATRAECGEQTAAEFVEALYQKQARLQSADFPRDGIEFETLFARNLRRMMQAPRHGLRRQPIGRLLHAFFGWGVLPVTEVNIGKVALVSGKDGGAATVSVELSHHGQTHQVLVHVVVEDEVRRIADISYDSGESLAAYYRELTRR
jgi:hypothetical protein